MIPMGFSGRKGTLLHAREVPDGFGVKREWTDTCHVFVSVYPISRTQTPTSEGLEPVRQFRIAFCLPDGKEARPDDRVTVGQKTYRLTAVTDYGSNINAVGELL